MQLISKQTRFELSLQGKDGSSEDGFQWLLIKVALHVDGMNFSTVGAWMTLDEWRMLGKTLEKIGAQPTDVEIEFIEPNIRFKYLSSEKQLIVSLDLEALPPWGEPGQKYSFECSPEECLTIGNRVLADVSMF